MADPRETIEQLMQAALESITPQTQPVRQAIRLVTRQGLMIDQVAPEDKPTIVILTEQNETVNRGLSGRKETTLTFALVIYALVDASDEPATVLNEYAEAVGNVLEGNRYWGGLAVDTTVEGVAQHEIMASMLPDAKTTIAVLVRYMWARDVA